MQLQTFKAPTMAEALAQVKREMGTQAVILHTRSYRVRYLLGLRHREIVEITAGKGLNVDRRRVAPGSVQKPTQARPKQIEAYVANSPLQNGKSLLESPAGNGAAML